MTIKEIWHYLVNAARWVIFVYFGHVLTNTPLCRQPQLSFKNKCNHQAGDIQLKLITQYIGPLAQRADKHVYDADAPYAGAVCVVSYQQNGMAYLVGLHRSA